MLTLNINPDVNLLLAGVRQAVAQPYENYSPETARVVCADGRDRLQLPPQDVVIGAGLYLLHCLRLLRTRAQVFEASHDVGGTLCRTGDNPNFDLAAAHVDAMQAVTS